MRIPLNATTQNTSKNLLERNSSPHFLRPAACPQDPCDLSEPPGTRKQAAGSRGCVVTLEEGLPVPVICPVELECEYTIIEEAEYFILHFTAKASLNFFCQRCGGEAQKEVTLNNSLAICPTDEVAERLMAQYEPIVAGGRFIDLEQILRDELHLATFYTHPDLSCSE